MNTTLQRQFRTFIRINQWRKEHVTAAGNLLLLIGGISLAGLFAVDSPLIPLGCSILGLLAVAGIGNLLLRPRLAARVHAPSKVERGEAVRFQVTVTNTARIHAFDMRFDLTPRPESWLDGGERPVISSLSPGESQTIKLSATPTRRGAFPWSVVRVESCFPFHLFQWRRTLDMAGELLVLPAYRPLQEIAPLLVEAHLVGDEFHQASYSGDSTDYLGAREYQPGVPVRRWDYSSWARTGAPAVREFEDSQRGSVAVLVDLCCDPTNAEALEGVIALTASLAEAVIADDRYLESVHLGPVSLELGSTAAVQLELLLEHLAVATAGVAEDLSQLRDQIDKEPVLAETVFVLTSRWTELHQKLSEEIARSGAAVHPLLVATTDTQAPSPEVRVLLLEDILPSEEEAPWKAG